MAVKKDSGMEIAMEKRIYTDEELLVRVWDREEIQDVMNLRVYYSANEERRKEIDELWVTEKAYRDTASFGKNWGFYVGMDSIQNYYVVEHAKKIRGLDEGYMTLQPISAPSIQIAADGKTAKGLWYSVGHMEIPQADGTIMARWVAMKVAVDLVKEQHTGWRIWHLLEISDSYFEPGIDYWKDMPVFEDPVNDELHVEFGTPDIEVRTHDRQFCWADNYPAMPEPYVTFTPEISWGPEGFKPFERWDGNE